jgi:hypothetical protein
MQDIKQRLEKLRVDAEECQLISRLATDPIKRNAFAQLPDEYQKMAHDLEALIASGNVPGALGI